MSRDHRSQPVKIACVVFNFELSRDLALVRPRGLHDQKERKSYLYGITGFAFTPDCNVAKIHLMNAKLLGTLVVYKFKF